MSVSIELTDEEARTLRVMFRFIGGQPEHSPRGHADNVDRKLAALGVPSRDSSESACLPFPETPGLYFGNYEKTPRIKPWTPQSGSAEALATIPAGHIVVPAPTFAHKASGKTDADLARETADRIYRNVLPGSNCCNATVRLLRAAASAMDGNR